MRFSIQDRFDIANYVISSINEDNDYRDIKESYAYWKQQIKNICSTILEDDEWKGKFYKHTKNFGEYEVRSIFDTIFKDIGRFNRSQQAKVNSNKKVYVYDFKHLSNEDLPKKVEFN